MCGSPYLVGDEANQLPKLPAYFAVNVSSSYQVAEKVELFARVRNLFDQHYCTYATLTGPGAIAYLNLTDPRTFIPGMPLAAYIGMRAAL